MEVVYKKCLLFLRKAKALIEFSSQDYCTTPVLHMLPLVCVVDADTATHYVLSLVVADKAGTLALSYTYHCTKKNLNF